MKRPAVPAPWALAWLGRGLGAGRRGLEAALDSTVAALLAKPAQALRLTQRLLRRGPTEEILQRMELENGHFAERLTSDEVRDAITAFFAARARPAPAA